ncbi:MAG TPA: ATP-dependent protease ATPase subunit HslU [Tepidisphaeraceae bacterium]|jgi:ATP-dependent HslUV protease ATP-binding subunit HslU|nr:ATP-dependent protease ATPase subunit HslU [Tepidisphaeraceae bacterium]
MNMTPKQIVSELDKFIVGQSDAKRAVAIALRNRWRRQQLPEGIRNDVYPKNIIMVGPTGVGKTEIARRLAGLTGAPFIKVEATKYTEVGYQGRDVESMIRDLVDYAIGMIRDEQTESVKESARTQVEDRLLDLLLPANPYNADEETTARYTRNREKLREQLRAGQLEDRQIEIYTEEKPNMSSLLGQAGLDVDMQNVFEKMMPTQRETKRMTVSSARQFLFRGEADKLLDKQKIIAEAITRTENNGIVFIDEIDKIAGSDPKSGPDVSRQGVQRDLLPIVEGSAVSTKHGICKTDHILFIAAGAFHDSKPSDLMPELQGRFPLRVELQDLTKFDFIRILKEPQNSLVKQQVALLATEGIEIVFTDDSIDAMAQVAWDVNKRTQNLGARRLYTVMEKVFEDLNFEASELADKKLTIDAKYVKQRLDDLASEGKRKFIF